VDVDGVLNCKTRARIGTLTAVLKGDHGTPRGPSVEPKPLGHARRHRRGDERDVDKADRSRRDSRRAGIFSRPDGLQCELQCLTDLDRKAPTGNAICSYQIVRAGCDDGDAAQQARKSAL